MFNPNRKIFTKKEDLINELDKCYTNRASKQNLLINNLKRILNNEYVLIYVESICRNFIK